MGLIIVLDGDGDCRPGDTLSGTLSWELTGEPKRIELSLLWFTSGKGTRDVGVVASETFDRPGRRGERAFRFALPDSPYSFSGRLITLEWAVEAVVKPGDELVRETFVLSPTGTEVRLRP